MMKHLIFFLLLINLYSFGQSDSIVIKRLKSDSIIKEYVDTSYYKYGIKQIGKIIRKHYDEKTDALVQVGWWRYFYRRYRLKDSCLYNQYGVVIFDKIYYRNGKIKKIISYDTTSYIFTYAAKKVITTEYNNYYIKKYYKTGTIKREGRKKIYNKTGEWIYYNKEGVVKKRKTKK
jgi:hypothetical protein